MMFTYRQCYLMIQSELHSVTVRGYLNQTPTADIPCQPNPEWRSVPAIANIQYSFLLITARLAGHWTCHGQAQARALANWLMDALCYT